MSSIPENRIKFIEGKRWLWFAYFRGFDDTVKEQSECDLSEFDDNYSFYNELYYLDTDKNSHYLPPIIEDIDWFVNVISTQ